MNYETPFCPKCGLLESSGTILGTFRLPDNSHQYMCMRCAWKESSIINYLKPLDTLTTNTYTTSTLRIWVLKK